LIDPFKPLRTRVRRWGFTDKTTTSAWLAAALLSVVQVMAYSLQSSSNLSWRGPAVIKEEAGAVFRRISPAIMASAITPGPIKAILRLSNIMHLHIKIDKIKSYQPSAISFQSKTQDEYTIVLNCKVCVLLQNQIIATTMHWFG
jgi:hypothetical protein